MSNRAAKFKKIAEEGPQRPNQDQDPKSKRANQNHLAVRELRLPFPTGDLHHVVHLANRRAGARRTYSSCFSGAADTPPKFATFAFAVQCTLVDAKRRTDTSSDYRSDVATDPAADTSPKFGTGAFAVRCTLVAAKRRTDTASDYRSDVATDPAADHRAITAADPGAHSLPNAPAIPPSDREAVSEANSGTDICTSDQGCSGA